MISIDDVQKLDLRVAEVVTAELHPNADKLLVLSIAIGEEKRTVVAGIKKDYAPEELIGKKVVAITNLEPATIRGVESHGMVLAASDNEKIVLVIPERDIGVGSIVK